jgi:rod shape-determining protein MreB
MCIPSESSSVEKRALEEAISSSGGRQVTLVEEALAAAIGAGLPIHEPVGHLIVDIGGARSEMAVVSMGGVVSGHGVPVGGFDLDAAIQEHLERRTASRSARKRRRRSSSRSDPRSPPRRVERPS